MPHNFNELLSASVAYLKGKKKFELYPDFQTGGLLDVSNYNDGQRGGKLRTRARIIQKIKTPFALPNFLFLKKIQAI